MNVTITNQIGESNDSAINELSKIIISNWDTLYEGARRLELNIPEDFYAPERIQGDGIRLHKHCGVKIIRIDSTTWHTYRRKKIVTEAQLTCAVKFVNVLFAHAEKNIRSVRIIVSTEKEGKNEKFHAIH